MLHVLDVSAINAAGRQPNAPLIFEALDDLIKDKRACFPDEVLEELERLARGEFTYTWTKAVATDRCDKGAAYKHVQSVAHLVPNLVDADAEHESSAVAVLAQARSLMLLRQDIVVVTEDVRPKPTRMALAEACQQLEVPWMPLPTCLSSCGYTLM